MVLWESSGSEEAPFVGCSAGFGKGLIGEAAVPQC